MDTTDDRVTINTWDLIEFAEKLKGNPINYVIVSPYGHGKISLLDELFGAPVSTIASTLVSISLSSPMLPIYLRSCLRLLLYFRMTIRPKYRSTYIQLTNGLSS